MGAQLKELLSDVVTNVNRTFDTTDGEYVMDLNIRHKRITTSVQLEMQRISETELRKLSESLDKRREAVRNAQDTGAGFDLDLLPVYEPRNITCLQLEHIVVDLDIIDEKKKPLLPTYENLIKLPVEVREAIKEELDNSSLPKKKTSTTLANTTLRAVSEDVPRIG